MESIIDILHKGGYSCVMKNREEVGQRNNLRYFIFKHII